MKTLNLILVFTVFFFSSFTLFAGNGTSLPSLRIKQQSLNSYVNADGVKAEMAKMEKVKAKVCACQILSLSSNNENHDYVAVFAEKTNNGNLNFEYATAMNVLEKEKKQIKEVFYPKMKMVQKITAYTSCDILASRLKTSNLHIDLKVYEIYDADILGNENVGK